eukprot:tig00021168_g19121.t1
MAPKRAGAGGWASGSQAGSQSSAGKSSYLSQGSQAHGTLGEINYRLEQFKVAVYGVALIANKDTDRSLRWRIFDLTIQTLSIVLVPLTLSDWGVGWGGPWQPIGEYLHGYLKFDHWEYRNFLALWAAVVALVGLAVLDVAYVGYAFTQHKFSFKFPLRYLRIAGHALPTAGFVPIIVVLLEMWDCPSLAAGPAPHMSFPKELTCWSGSHSVLVAVSTVAVVAYVALCLGFVLFFYEVDPRKRNNWTARPHARSELASLVALLAAAVALSSSAIPHVAEGLLCLATGAFALWSVFTYFAYYLHWMNCLRAAAYAAYTWVAFFIFIEGRYKADLRHHGSPGAFYAIMLVGALAAAAAGWYAADRFFVRMHLRGGAFGLRMARPWHVELGTRFLHADRSKAALEVAEVIFHRGLQLFPYSAAVRVAYGSFRLEVDDSPQMGYRQFQEAAKLGPFLDLDFQVWRAEHQRVSDMQAGGLDSSGGRGGGGKRRAGEEADALIGFLEFQRDMEGARKYHKGCVRAFKKFWGLLVAEDVTLARLEKAVSTIDHNETRAQAHYRALVARFPNNPRILRSYAKFHEEVLNDPAAAQDLYDAADEFEETAAAQTKKDAGNLDADLESEAGEEGGAGAAQGAQDDSVRAGYALASSIAAGAGSGGGGGHAPPSPSPPPPPVPFRTRARAQVSLAGAALAGGAGAGAGALGGGFASMGFGGLVPPAPDPAAEPAVPPDSIPDGRRLSVMALENPRLSVPRGSVTGVAAWLAQAAQPAPTRSPHRSPAPSAQMERETVFALVFGVGAEAAVGRPLGALVAGVRAEPDVEREKAAGGNLLAAALGVEMALGQTRRPGEVLLPDGSRRGALLTVWPADAAPSDSPSSVAYRLTVRRTEAASPADAARTSPALAAAPAPARAAPPPVGLIRQRSKTTSFRLPSVDDGDGPAAAKPPQQPPHRPRPRRRSRGAGAPPLFRPHALAAHGGAQGASWTAKGAGAAGSQRRLQFGSSSVKEFKLGELPSGGPAVHALDSARPGARPGAASPPAPVLLGGEEEDSARLAEALLKAPAASGAKGTRRASIADAARREAVAEYEPEPPADEWEADADGKSAGRGSSVARAKSIKRLNRLKRRLAATGASDEGIGRMRRTVLFVVVVLLALAVAFYFTVDGLVSVYDKGIVRVGESSRRALEACSAPIYGRMLALAGLPGWPDPHGELEKHAREKLGEYLDELEEYHLDLRDVGAQLHVKLHRVVSDDGHEVEDDARLWDAGFEVIDSGRDLLKYPSSAALRAAWPDPLRNPRFKFLVDNGPTTIYEAFLATAREEDERAFKGFESIRIFVEVMLAVASVLCFVLAVFFFRPTIQAVRREKEAALRLFFDIPPATVRAIARGAGGAGEDFDEDLDDLNFEDDADFADDAAVHGKKASAKRSDDGEGDGELEDGAASVGAGAHASREEARKARKLRRIFERRGRSVDPITVRYVAAFFTLFLAFLAWFLVSYLTSQSCEYFTSERAAAGLRRAERNQVLYYAQELVVDATGVFGAKYAKDSYVKHAAEELKEAVEKLEHDHRDLLYGNAKEHLPGSVRRFPAQDRLLFGVDCLVEREVCLAERERDGHRFYNGMHRLLMLYITHARMLAASPRHLLTPNNTHYQFIVWAAEGPLDLEMKHSIDLYVDEAHIVLGRFMTYQKLLVAVACVTILACYLGVFRGIIRSVSDDARRTLFLLLIIPAEVIDQVESIRAHLIRKAAASVAAGPAS